MGIFNFPVCTIFAREVLEATLIIGQYRTVIKKSPQYADEDKQKEALKAVTSSTLIASAIAVVMIAAITIPLGIAAKSFDNRAAMIIEGVSKIVAAVCILQLSTKCPKWLGFYASKKVMDGSLVEGLTLKSIKFNVAWNIWREVAEVGVFLLPFFLGENSLVEVPVSGAVGIVVGLVAGIGIYYISASRKDLFWLAFSLSAVTGMLSVGLFTGGCHKFEMVGWGSTPIVWKLEGKFWDQNRLPMTIIKPFGYSSTRTLLHMICFWSWTILLFASHYYKYKQSQRIFAERAAEKEESANGTDKIKVLEDEPEGAMPIADADEEHAISTESGGENA
jgi:high-affinity iron transporter